MKKIVIKIPVFTILVSLFSVLVSFSFRTDTIPETRVTLSWGDTVTISFVGDLMCHSPQIANSRQADGSYNFDPSFEYIRPFLASADFMIGNLELTCAGPGPGYKGYPAFNAPDEYITALKNAGFDFLVTANNHSMDTGEEGLLRTLKIIRARNLGSTGTFSSKADQDSIRIVNVKSLRLALLNYTYGTNGAYPAKQRSWMLNLIDSARITSDCARARELGADAVAVIYHNGTENIMEPTADQKAAYRWAVDAGADLIIGAHPHVVSSVEYYKTNAAALDSGVIAWSLGNFLSNQYWRYSDAGVVFSVTLVKDDSGKVTLLKTSYLPTWVYRGTNSLHKKHVILPACLCKSDSVPSFVDSVSKQKMTQAYDDTRAVMMKKCGKVCEDVIKQERP